MENNLNTILRALPSVEEVLGAPAVAALEARLPRTVVVDAVRDELNAIRAKAIETKGTSGIPDDIPARAAARALRLLAPSMRRVINASGVIIHTNLGRSVLAEEAVRAVTDVARGYSTLEYTWRACAAGAATAIASSSSARSRALRPPSP